MSWGFGTAHQCARGVLLPARLIADFRECCAAVPLQHVYALSRLGCKCTPLLGLERFDAYRLAERGDGCPPESERP